MKADKKSTSGSNGCMVLKVELQPTGRVRAIPVPECMTLEDSHEAMQAVMGWGREHLWHFESGGRDGGTCAFVDDDMSIGAYFLDFFDGLKVKDGAATPFRANPSDLTVHKAWVGLYAAHREEWRNLRGQMDILESYANSALVGAIPPEAIYKSMVMMNLVGKLSMKPRQNLIDALSAWSETLHAHCLNGNAVRDPRAREAAKAPAQSPGPRIPCNAPCPRGSGNKYKLCCRGMA